MHDRRFEGDDYDPAGTATPAGLTAAINSLTAMFNARADAADHVGRAADRITAATTSPRLQRAHRDAASIGAWSFAALLDKLFQRDKNMSGTLH